MSKKIAKTIVIPEELKDVATTSDIGVLDEKLGKCYSTERYEDFQEAVKKIVISTLSSEDGSEKVKKHASTYFKGQIIWGIVLWAVTIIGTALLEKLTHFL